MEPLTPAQQSVAAEWFALARSTARSFANAKRCDHDDAESEAMLALMRAVRTYDPARGQLRHHLAAKIWLDLLTWWAPRTAPKRFLRSQNASLDPANEPDDGGKAARQIRASLVAALLIRLAPPRDRPLLTDHYREGLSIRGIAAARGLTYTSAHGRIARALEQVRQQFAPREPEPAPAPPPPPVPLPCDPHPDWPGYGVDRDGRIWSFKRGAPRIITVSRSKWGVEWIKIRCYGRIVNMPARRFLDTHPLHAQRKAG